MDGMWRWWEGGPRGRGYMYTYHCFPCGSAGKESACSEGDLGLIPRLGRAPGEGKGYVCQYSGLENAMDCIVHGVVNSRTRLRDFHFHIYNCFTSLYSSN